MPQHRLEGQWPIKTLFWGHLEIVYRDETLRLSCFHRTGSSPALLYLHGLGTTKSDFIDVLDVEPLRHHGVLALDFPGCGHSPYSRLHHFDLRDVVAIVDLTLRQLRVKDVVVIGHSVGGVVGLYLAEQLGVRARGFVNIEGNLVPSDCFLSRRIATHDGDQQFWRSFADELQVQTEPGFQTFAARFVHAVTQAAFFDYARSVVAQTDADGLLDRFIRLATPKLFVHGDQNQFAYLHALEAGGVRIASIPRSHHFPAYSNPVALFRVIADFVSALGC